MIHSSIIIVYVCINIWYYYCTVFSDKLVMATGHAMPMLINLHLFEWYKSLKTCIAWPVAMASFTTDSIIIIHTKARSYKHWMYSYKTTSGPGSVWVFYIYFLILLYFALKIYFKFNLLSFLYVFFIYLEVVLVWYNDKNIMKVMTKRDRIYKQPRLIQPIVHSAFNPLGGEAALSLR